MSAPPVRDPRAVRHSTRLVQRARELVDAGWTTGETSRQLAEEFALERVPALTTIRRWTEPGYAELHRTWQIKCERDKGKPGRFLTDDLLLALREEDEMTFRSIAAVARRFYGVELTVEQVRLRLYALGVEKNPNKVRATRLQHERAAA